MELILWRHAEAEAGDIDQPDAARALTPKGQKQAAKMAEWLDRVLPNTCRVLTSPTTRTVQTASALGRKFKIMPHLGPDSTAEEVLEAAHWPTSREPVLIVGHQPFLGQIAALLITGQRDEWTLRKGAICWIAQRVKDETDANFIRAVMGPDLVGK
ncbi:SixA phosphatase family protein [Noviherbaspirillum autotrophicum]|uniref:Phosphohistidine phosphatase n=1 Tax=Noviherbaspirillum autotrophicum TaxID=709839 RepID=A0A0C1YTT1_9BURK|nr:histidine phosphatase family protein [Noviherbaspirillum autotrophicum]KIF81671.1 phosphohistidine phosphatase [Noviherbaspirillum autotrophicum]KIF82032.1 phosphohistidine phosphatase [Noviherbaspirillum autotrophicum]KIF84082.1 phosphohistidine phosphatase [Noviherbaspirillum autotrophicum]